MVDVDLAFLGRRVIAEGLLQKQREELGLTRSAMAELLHTTVLTYTSWEVRKGDVRMWDSTAERVGRFHLHANRHLATLDSFGIDISDLVPLFTVAAQLGVSMALLLRRYRENAFGAEDLGILGLWIHKEDLDLISGTL
jgi:hypothetical protein